jgi:enoyl-CoA hydratase/carnithine racemase
MDATTRYEAADGIARIALARPDKRNAMNAQMFDELADAAERAASDERVRLVVVSGDGPSFCAGIDIGELARLASIDRSEIRSFVEFAQRPFRTLALMPKPSIAAVQGHAVGAGFQLALACDLRVVAPDASFAMLEVGYGLIPDLGGAHRLARAVGTARAKDLVWTGRSVDAGEALAISLANRLAPDDDLAGETDRLAQAILAQAPVPQRLTKVLIDQAAETPFEAELEREAEAQVTAVASDDFREAVSAFAERRRPRFTGR